MTPAMIFHVGLPAALGTALLWVALSPGRLGLGPSRQTSIALGLAGPLLFAGAAAFFPTMEIDMHRDFVCGDLSLIMGAVPVIALAIALRRGFVVGAARRGALLGVAGGLLGAAALGLHCSVTDGMHIAIGHGSPVIVLAVAAAFVLGRSAKVT
jgi:hypothetical protein